MKKIFITLILLTLFLTGCASPAAPTRDLALIPTEEASATPLPPEETAPPEDAPLASPSPEGEENRPTDPTPESDQAGKGQELPYRSIIELVVRDLALRLDLEVDQIQVLAVESVEWPDAGLGCPVAGMDYAQVITPGYRITLGAEGEAYLYHTNTERAFVLCREGDPALPVIPVDPDEIQDGVPWMPVDPLPTLIEGKDTTDPEPIK